MPIDVKCPECGSMNEVYGSDCGAGSTVKRCVNCGAFLDPGHVKKALKEGKIEKFIWIGDDGYIGYMGSGKLVNLVTSLKNNGRLYQVHMKVEKIERLKENGQMDKVIYPIQKNLNVEEKE